MSCQNYLHILESTMQRPCRDMFVRQLLCKTLDRKSWPAHLTWFLRASFVPTQASGLILFRNRLYNDRTACDMFTSHLAVTN